MNISKYSKRKYCEISYRDRFISCYIHVYKSNSVQPGEQLTMGKLIGFIEIHINVNQVFWKLHKRGAMLWGKKTMLHTWYLSRIPRIYLCKSFLAGVNFYRFNAKNWHFRQILREKVAFFTDLTRKIGVFRCKFYSSKILSV